MLVENTRFQNVTILYISCLITISILVRNKLIFTEKVKPLIYKMLTGTATHWPEYLLYNLETDEEERMQDVKNAAVPYNNVGLLEVTNG